MELIGFGIIVAAVVWGATEVMKHFFPSWEQDEVNRTRHWLHDRVDDVEERVTRLYDHLGVEEKDK